jgi:Arc/MetJ-type ribon-helix-helix transcriptional regulator
MKQITARIDGAAEEAMDELVAATGLSQSQVIRDALVVARRERLKAQLRADALRVRHDPADLAEAQDTLAEMQARRAR